MLFLQEGESNMDEQELEKQVKEILEQLGEKEKEWEEKLAKILIKFIKEVVVQNKKQPPRLFIEEFYPNLDEGKKDKAIRILCLVELFRKNAKLIKNITGELENPQEDDTGK